MKIVFWAFLGGSIAATLGPTTFRSVTCFRNSGCSEFAEIEASALGMLATFVLAVAVVSWKFAHNPQNKLLYAAVGGGAVFLLQLFTVIAEEKFPVQSINMMAFLLVLLFGIVAIPYALTPEDAKPQWIGRIYSYIFGTMVVAIGIGATTQILGEIAWVGFDGWSASKFVVAPSGTVIAGSAWCMMALIGRDDETLESHRIMQRIWIAAAATTILLFPFLHGLLFTREHVAASNWITTAALGNLALILPGIVTGFLIFSIKNNRIVARPWTSTITLLMAITAGVIAFALGYALKENGNVIADDIRSQIAFAFSHGITVLGVVLSVYFGHKIPPLLARTTSIE